MSGLEVEKLHFVLSLKMNKVGKFIADYKKIRKLGLNKSVKWTIFEIVLMFIEAQCFQKHLELLKDA